MPAINPLDHPVVLSYPQRIASTAWVGHVPFAMYLVDVLRPKIIVELGTFTGVSYCAFCQAVDELALETRCFAVDTWEGDSNNGFYGPEVLADLERHHDPRYRRFSRLLQSSFDDALDTFDDGTIDLLHIDGFHPYEAVMHDFESWSPKLSSRGVVLLHDTNVRMINYGVWKLWEELKPRYPHFEFVHEHGLGILATGEEMVDGIRALVSVSEEEAAVLRDFFRQLGMRINAPAADDADYRTLQQVRARLTSILESRAWRWVNRYGRVKARLQRPAHRLRGYARRNKTPSQ